MALIVKDRVLESSMSTGTGSFTLTGAQTGYQSFSAIGNGNTTYYTIQGKNPDGTLTGEWEVGEGTWSTGNTLARNTVFSNSLETTAKIDFSAGSKDVFVTYPSDKALLGDTSAVSSTGTGSVVLNNNPVFDTDITVNSMYVGKGFWQDTTSSAFGFAALESPYGTVSNNSMTGIGYNTLSSFGVGIASVSITNGGSGYYDDEGATDTFSFSATLDYVSGPTSSGVYPTALIEVDSGVITKVTITDVGYGFPDTGATVFTAVNPLGGGSGLLLSRNTFKIAINNTALGYFAGSTNLTGSNSVYLGYGATGTGSNQIIIGSNITAGNDNSVIIGNTSITITTLRGAVSATSFAGAIIGTTGSFSNTLSASAAISLTGSTVAASSYSTANTSGNITFGTAQTTGTLIIGGTAQTGAITLGRSTGAQTINIATGANTATKAVNIATGSASGATNITLGSTTGTSTTTVNGLLKQNTYTVANLPTGTAGSRSFVTNALTPAFGAAVVGGGAVGVPVYHDGTSWKVG